MPHIAVGGTTYTAALHSERSAARVTRAPSFAFLRSYQPRLAFPSVMFGLNFGGGGANTFKPSKKAVPGSRRFDLHKHAEATLGGGNLQQAVLLPAGEDLNDWLAVNVTDFYNEISLLYGVLMDVCTPTACPTMCAGPKFEYKWADGVRIKKPVRCSAPKYVDYMMTWVQTTLDDEAIFPVRVGEPFPPNIREIICTMFKRLFRVYAHMYMHHFAVLKEMGAEPHLNTCFRHFVLFVHHFSLIEPRELAPLQELIDKLLDRSKMAPVPKDVTLADAPKAMANMSVQQ
jgi:MOB kinase activator 1